MWKCESCGREFNGEATAIEVRFGYVDSEEVAKDGDQYMAFNTESAWAPLCDTCAIAYITGEEISEPKI